MLPRAWPWSSWSRAGPARQPCGPPASGRAARRSLSPCEQRASVGTCPAHPSKQALRLCQEVSQPTPHRRASRHGPTGTGQRCPERSQRPVMRRPHAAPALPLRRAPRRTACGPSRRADPAPGGPARPPRPGARAARRRSCCSRAARPGALAPGPHGPRSAGSPAQPLRALPPRCPSGPGKGPHAAASCRRSSARSPSQPGAASLRWAALL
mmetsp:Transcript_133329/g.371689  ORF Transcript_133329/g.371689 Transcript_133329/m.371689 type:complete len:211 (-) Transcript_133329:104-736(-)